MAKKAPFKLSPKQIMVLQELRDNKDADLRAAYNKSDPDKVWYAYWRSEPDAKEVTDTVRTLIKHMFLRAGHKKPHECMDYVSISSVSLLPKAYNWLRRIEGA